MSYHELLTIIAILPVVLICIYVYRKDKNKEPSDLLMKLILSGIVSCFLTLILSSILSVVFPMLKKTSGELTFLETIIQIFFGIAFVEEFSKFVMVYLFGYKSKEFDEIYDIIVYSVFVSLGFAAFENMLYVFGNVESAISIGILRGLISIPGHACFALYMGYYLSLARLNKDKRNIYIINSIFVPAILHGIFDFCLTMGNVLYIVLFLVFVITLYIISVKKLKRLSNENKKIFTQNYCSRCGEKVIGNYCGNCGKKRE